MRNKNLGAKRRIDVCRRAGSRAQAALSLTPTPLRALLRLAYEHAARARRCSLRANALSACMIRLAYKHVAWACDYDSHKN